MSDDIPTHNLHDLYDAWLRDTRREGLVVLGWIVAWLVFVSGVAFAIGWATA